MKKSAGLSDQDQIIKWYNRNKRPLPWRKKTDPYLIWISEVMLQQTTVSAVIPYYKKFINKFKNVKSLAQAPLQEVISCWSGLGYYSRVKNLHKSAQIIHKEKYFPQTYKELIKLPGFGPYTARAVSSLAFDEKTGILDANVIRVLTRYLGFKTKWWDKKGRTVLQTEADKWAQNTTPSTMNQALMELGSLVCTVQKPLCLTCALKKNCQALKYNKIHSIPLKKKKKEKEIWLWKPVIVIKNNQVALTQNHFLPVLKSYPLFPGPAIKRKTPPEKYDFIHSITHHAIYVSISKKKIFFRQKCFMGKKKTYTDEKPFQFDSKSASP